MVCSTFHSRQVKLFKNKKYELLTANIKYQFPNNKQIPKPK